MPALDNIYSELPRFIPIILISIFVFVSLRLIKWLWLGKKVGAFSDHKIVPQVLMIIFSTIGAILIILALPVSDSLRGNIISLIGLVVTGHQVLLSPSIFRWATISLTPE